MGDLKTIGETTLETEEMDKLNLAHEFEYIRETFFPRWDRKREWNIKAVQRLPDGAVKGFYDDVSKAILIPQWLLSKNQDWLHSVLIHEISHCASIYHGKRFQKRYSKAGDEAKRIGRKLLANFIFFELEQIRTGKRTSLK